MHRIVALTNIFSANNQQLNTDPASEQDDLKKKKSLKQPEGFMTLLFQLLISISL